MKSLDANRAQTFNVRPEIMDTFDDLQMPFELFKAPIAHACVDAAGECLRCAHASIVRFHGLCYACFRNGHSDEAIDTELGMVMRELATQGMTHGLPLDDPAAFRQYGTTAHPVDPKFPHESWFHIHVAPVWLYELLRTPRYLTWQGERWLFCCCRPMVFRGSISADLLGKSELAIDLQMRQFLQQPHWRETIGGVNSAHTYYLFTCGACGHLRHHDDCD